MSKIKVAELFYSLQGEGQYVGVPSIFLRTFGCNFTCSGFGMPRGELSTERLRVDPSQYSDYNELPLVSTGCDSYASWDPKFKHLSPLMEVDQITHKISEMLPGGTFGRDKHLIITGGEPLLGWQRSYPELLDKCIKMGLTNLTFETNGTQFLTEEFGKYLYRTTYDRKLNITFSISAKLPCSGEKWEDAIRPDVIKQYFGHIPAAADYSYFKFVVATHQDVEDAERAKKEYQDAGIDIPVYLMPVGGVNSVYELNERNVADYCRDHGLRFSPRIQVPLYKNAWGT
jgi:7-carboxy-7-deazaguanine synthase